MRLQGIDESAIGASGVRRAPCIVVEQRGARLDVRGDESWWAPIRPVEVGRTGWQWDGERLIARTGRYGFRALFYRELPGGIAMSPSLVRLLAVGGPPVIDDGALGVFLRLGFFVGEDTPFRGVRVLPPSAGFEWRAGRLCVDGSYVRPVPRTMSRDAAIDAYIDTFRAAVRRLASHGGPHLLPLSGGRDSRHILFELCGLGTPPVRCLTLRNYPPRGARDIEIAKELAGALGLTHEIVDEQPSRAFAELRKNLATHFCADEHAWFVPLADAMTGVDATLWDGIAGDVLSNGHRLSAVQLGLARAGRAEDLAEAMLDESVLRLVPPAAAARLDRESAVARLAAELKRHLDAPNPLGSFVFWNRTRREIALVPFGLWDGVRRVATPFLDPDVFDLLSALPAEMFLDRQFHGDAIRRAFPQYATLRFDTESTLPPISPPNHTPQDAAYYRRLLRETGAYVGRAPASRYVRRWWVLARAAYWTLRGDFSDASVMPWALYLAQLETMTRWGADARPGHS